jgi:hypothetical protein
MSSTVQVLHKFSFPLSNAKASAFTAVCRTRHGVGPSNQLTEQERASHIDSGGQARKVCQRQGALHTADP